MSLVPIVIFFFKFGNFPLKRIEYSSGDTISTTVVQRRCQNSLKLFWHHPWNILVDSYLVPCQGSNRLAIVCLYAQVCHVVVYSVWYYKNLIHTCYHGWFTSCCSVPGLNTAGYITLNKKKEKIKQYPAMYRWQAKLAPPFSHHGQPTSCSSGLSGLRTPHFCKGWVGLSQYCWTCLERPPVSPIINDNHVGGCNHLNGGL